MRWVEQYETQELSKRLQENIVSLKDALVGTNLTDGSGEGTKIQGNIIGLEIALGTIEEINNERK